jgi:hypothetical protein
MDETTQASSFATMAMSNNGHDGSVRDIKLRGDVITPGMIVS